jgi:hypothetical protein
VVPASQRAAGLAEAEEDMAAAAARVLAALGDVSSIVTGWLRAAAGTGTGVRADGSAVLSPADLIEVLGALDHAEQLLRERAAAWCEECSTSPAEACREHLDQLDEADAYRALAARLGGVR